MNILPAKYINQHLYHSYGGLHYFVHNRRLVRLGCPVRVLKPLCNLSPGSSPFTALSNILTLHLQFNVELRPNNLQFGWVFVKEDSGGSTYNDICMSSKADYFSYCRIPVFVDPNTSIMRGKAWWA